MGVPVTRGDREESVPNWSYISALSPCLGMGCETRPVPRLSCGEVIIPVSSSLFAWKEVRSSCGRNLCLWNKVQVRECLSGHFLCMQARLLCREWAHRAWRQISDVCNSAKQQSRAEQLHSHFNMICPWKTQTPSSVQKKNSFAWWEKQKVWAKNSF